MLLHPPRTLSFARRPVLRAGSGLSLPSWFVHRRFRSGGGADELFVGNLLLGLAPMILMAPLWSSFALPDCLSSLTDAFLPVTGLVQQRVRAFLETIGQLRH